MPTPRGAKRAARARRTPAPPARRALHYKVVELSSVDEVSLERTVNEWSQRGWTFDGVQFAMRDSSKRPSMAFVFFTKEGAPLVESADDGVPRVPLENEAPVQRVSSRGTTQDAWSRLQALSDGVVDP